MTWRGLLIMLCLPYLLMPGSRMLLTGSIISLRAMAALGHMAVKIKFPIVIFKKNRTCITGSISILEGKTVNEVVVISRETSNGVVAVDNRWVGIRITVT